MRERVGVNRSRLWYSGVAALLLLVAGSSAGQAADAATAVPGVAAGCSWQVKALPLPAGYTQGVVNKGDGAGAYAGWGIGAAGTQVPLVWRNGQVQEIPTPGGVPGTALDINRAGVVLATYDGTSGGPNQDGPHGPYLWQNGKIIVLAMPPVGGSATAINDAGVIVGSGSMGDGTLHALMWKAATPTTYSDLGTAGAVSAALLDVSNAGAFVGDSGEGGWSGRSKAIGGSLKPAYPLQALPGLDPAVNSDAKATAGSFVVGIGRLADGSNGVSGGPIYADAATSSKPKALLGTGTPFDVNTKGLVAGISSTSISRVTATVWTPTQRWSLPNLFTATTAASWARTAAEDGTIAGYSFEVSGSRPQPVTWTCR